MGAIRRSSRQRRLRHTEPLMTTYTRILLQDGLVLKAYETGWIVADERIYATGKRAGEKYDFDLGYFSTLRSALEGLMEHSVRRSGSESLTKLLDAIQAFREEVSHLLGPSLVVKL